MLVPSAAGNSNTTNLLWVPTGASAVVQQHVGAVARAAQSVAFGVRTADAALNEHEARVVDPAGQAAARAAEPRRRGSGAAARNPWPRRRRASHPAERTAARPPIRGWRRTGRCPAEAADRLTDQRPEDPLTRGPVVVSGAETAREITAGAPTNRGTRPDDPSHPVTHCRRCGGLRRSLGRRADDPPAIGEASAPMTLQRS